MRRIAVLVGILALLGTLLPLSPVHAADRHDDVVGSYIVVLNDGEPGSVADDHRRRHNASVRHVYRHALRGYAARMSERAAANITRDPRVAYVEQDGAVTAWETQTNPTWGLDRIDQATGLDQAYTYTQTGAGVHAYIVDTGIRASHADFGGRVGGGTTTIYDGRGTDDCDGHGTHVAGTVGGTTYGVAKAVTLVPVRVLDCNGSGTWSGVIAGLDWVTANAVKPAVANMSLGGGASAAVDDAVQRTITSGVSVVVAAGNGNRGGKEQDACDYSPARVPAAITIGATTSSDEKTSWSNYGSCVDFFAPGAAITSAWYTGDSATNTISGTSMAAPHVTGAAALHLEGSASSTPQQVSDALYANTTKGIVSSSKTDNNHLLFTGSSDVPIDGGETGDSGGTANTAPTAQAQSATVAAGSSIEIALTGTDSETCDLTFTAGTATAGTVGAPQARSCTPGTPNSDTAVVVYTPASGTTATSDSFTYTVADEAGVTSSPATVSITITHAPQSGGATASASISASPYGGKYGDNHVDVPVSVNTDNGPVSGAGVTVVMTNDGRHFWSGAGTTDSAGTVTFSFKHIPAGSYVATVDDVRPPAGVTWDGTRASTTWTK